jgi:hypothetical protein
MGQGIKKPGQSLLLLQTSGRTLYTHRFTKFQTTARFHVLSTARTLTCTLEHLNSVASNDLYCKDFFIHRVVEVSRRTWHFPPYYYYIYIFWAHPLHPPSFLHVEV